MCNHRATGVLYLQFYLCYNFSPRDSTFKYLKYSYSNFGQHTTYSLRQALVFIQLKDIDIARSSILSRTKLDITVAKGL